MNNDKIISFINIIISPELIKAEIYMYMHNVCSKPVLPVIN